MELGHAAAEAGFLHDEVAPREGVDRVLHARLIEGHHRVAVVLLIAGIGECVQGKRILVWGRNLLFDEAADHACLLSRELNVHARMISGCSSSAASIWRVRAAAFSASSTTASLGTGSASR